MAATHMGHPNIQGGVQTYGRHSNIQGAIQTCGYLNIQEVHPNIWGHPNIQGVHQNIWGHPNIQGVSKHKGGHPNIWVVSKHMGASKHTGGIQTLQQAEKCCQQCYTYGVNQTYREASKHTAGASKYNGWCPNIGGIQTWVVSKHGGHANIQGVSKHMGASECRVAYGHPISVTKHAFFVLLMYRGHPDVWGHMDTPFIWQSMLSLCCVCMGASKHTGGVQTYGASKHTGGCPNIGSI